MVVSKVAHLIQLAADIVTKLVSNLILRLDEREVPHIYASSTGMLRLVLESIVDEVHRIVHAVDSAAAI